MGKKKKKRENSELPSIKEYNELDEAEKVRSILKYVARLNQKTLLSIIIEEIISFFQSLIVFICVCGFTHFATSNNIYILLLFIVGIVILERILHIILHKFIEYDSLILLFLGIFSPITMSITLLSLIFHFFTNLITIESVARVIITILLYVGIKYVFLIVTEKKG